MKNLFLIFSTLIILCISCKKEEIQTIETDINGKVQKGPFLVGSDVTISELDNLLNQTGKVFFTNIIDNQGNFGLPKVNLNSKYLLVKTTGGYFNELDSAINLDLTLSTVSDINVGNTINLNILTHLISDRIIKLHQDGINFENSKEQAQTEFLTLFSLQNYAIGDFDKLDLTNISEGNEILLALNAVIVGSLSDIKLKEFLTRFITDFKENGLIDDQEIQSRLATNALFSSPNYIMNNLKARYNELGLEIGELNTTPYLNQFISNTNYLSFFNNEIPKETEKGINLLTVLDGIKLDTLKNYTIALSNSDTQDKTIYLNVITSESNGNIIFDNPVWHSSSNGENIMWSFSQIDNGFKLKDSGKLTLIASLSIGNDYYIYVKRNYSW